MKPAELPKRMTIEEWRAEAERRFGESEYGWKFECPSCGHIQSPEDFRPFKSAGASSDSVYQECIGRYTGAAGAFDPKRFKPCNYAMYGLFRLNHVEVVRDDGSTVGRVFPFAPDPEKSKVSPSNSQTDT